MNVNNPFEMILDRLDQLQTTIHDLSIQQAETKATSDSDPERLLNLTEAAELMRKPVGTVRSYIHSRDLPATKIGKSYLIKHGELLKWVNGFQNKKETGELLHPMLENRKRYRKY